MRLSRQQHIQHDVMMMMQAKPIDNACCRVYDDAIPVFINLE